MPECIVAEAGLGHRSSDGCTYLPLCERGPVAVVERQRAVVLPFDNR
jgi:hypothetical protein